MIEKYSDNMGQASLRISDTDDRPAIEAALRENVGINDVTFQQCKATIEDIDFDNSSVKVYSGCDLTFVNCTNMSSLKVTHAKVTCHGTTLDELVHGRGSQCHFDKCTINEVFVPVGNKSLPTVVNSIVKTLLLNSVPDAYLSVFLMNAEHARAGLSELKDIERFINTRTGIFRAKLAMIQAGQAAHARLA